MGVQNLREFNKALEDFAKKAVPAQVTALQKKIALDVVAGAVQLTPVDSGRARGGWQAVISDGDERKVDRVDKTGRETIAEASAVIEKVPDFDVITIQNNVDYIGFIEEGTDKMPPVGMVRRTIQRIQGIGVGRVRA